MPGGVRSRFPAVSWGTLGLRRRDPGAEDPPGSVLRRITLVCGRALRLRCPHCGLPGVRRGWFHFVPSCPRCGLRFERGESDHWLGGYLINFIVVELLIVAFMVIAILATWPAVPWKAVVYGALVPAIGGPLLTYPFAKNLWLAIDLLLRPAEGDDFEARP